MNRRFIKYHSKSNTYVIEKRAYFDEDIVLAGNVIVGQEVSFWKDLKVKGKLDLGRRALVRGNVKADSALLCSGSRILGRLDVSSDLHLLDNAKVRAAYCKGDVLARPGCFMGFIKAEGTLEIIGKVNIRDVEPITKVIVRAEDMSLSVSEDTVNYTSEDMSQHISENTPNIPENISENTPNISENTPNIPENTPNIPENTPNIPENTPNISENTPNISENTPNIPENISENTDEGKPWYISEDLSEDMLEDLSDDILEENTDEYKPWYISEDTVEIISSERSTRGVNEVGLSPIKPKPESIE